MGKPYSWIGESTPGYCHKGVLERERASRPFVLQLSHDSLRAKWSKGLSVAYHLSSDFEVDLFFSTFEN
jgi:hypothetical protein